MIKIMSVEASKFIADVAEEMLTGKAGLSTTKRAEYFNEAIELFQRMDQKMAYEDEKQKPDDKMMDAYNVLTKTMEMCFPQYRGNKKEIIGRLGFTYQVLDMMKGGSPVPNPLVSLELVKKFFLKLTEVIVVRQMKEG